MDEPKTYSAEIQEADDYDCLSAQPYRMTKDYHRVLGLANNAEDVVIRAAFKLLAHRYHPDKWREEKERANRMMTEINEAYQHVSKHGHAIQTGSDFYQVLGLLSHVDAQMIHAAYEALAHKYRNAPARLTEINQAYQTLSDVRKRKIYDFKQRKPVFYQAHGLSLWKIYLAYNLVFYVLMGAIFILAMMI